MTRRPGGRTNVPKLLHDAISGAPGLTGVDRDVLMAVCRWTYGHYPEDNVPNGARIGPSFLAAETPHSADACKKSVRRMKGGPLIETEPRRGRRSACLKVQPDPRLWHDSDRAGTGNTPGLVPDELLAKWTAAAGADGIDEAVAEAARPTPSRSRATQTGNIVMGTADTPRGISATPTKGRDGGSATPPQRSTESSTLSAGTTSATAKAADVAAGFIEDERCDPALVAAVEADYDFEYPRRRRDAASES